MPLLLAALSLGAVGCRPDPKTPASMEAQDTLGASFARAHETEQGADSKTAVAAYLGLVDEGLTAGEDGVRAVLAGLDGLLWRSTPGLSRLGGLHALAFRVPGALMQVEERLTALHGAGKGHPVARGLLARGLLELARFRGDAPAASRWRAAAGEVQQAVVVGPLSPAALTGILAATALEDGPLQATYSGVGPFARSIRPLTVEADDGVLNASAASPQPGLYAVVVDVEVPRAQRVWLGAQTTAGAVLAVQGRTVLQRPYALGGSPALRFGWVDAGPGLLRVVLRLGANEDGARLTLTVLGEDGSPLPCKAPVTGSAASALVQGVGAFEIAPRKGPSLELTTAALLALGESRTARRLLEEGAPTPGALLLFARALDRSDDLPENRRIERARAAYEQVTKAWPGSWEAALGSVSYTAARKDFGEGSVEAIRELARLRAEGRVTSPLLRVFEAVVAADVGLRDIALGSWEGVKKDLDETPLLASLEERVFPRIGAEVEARVCTAPGFSRGSLACLQARQSRGDLAGALAELNRLRELRGSPRALLRQELALRLAQGDTKEVLRIHDALPPGERSLATLGFLDDEVEVRERFFRDRVVSRDTPGQLPLFRRLLGEDLTRSFEEEGRKVVEQDRKSTASSTAATLVLLHTERYELAPDGLLRAVLHDVRKVSGTTDVEQGIGGISFSLVGRDLHKLLRRRIHKRDGRLLEPDAAAMAAQGNSDLSQLEPGDYVEQIAEVWILPDRAGHVVIDTEDLLPERTGVRLATLEVRYPRDLKLARWSHPLLGKAEERDEGEQRVVRFRLENASPRRMEEGAPRMDRDVAISFGTYAWSDVGRHLGELLAALQEDDPYVSRWARQAAGDAAGRAAVERVVQAAGKAIRVSQSNLLSDSNAALYVGPQTLSARHILELGQGSRSWVVYRALQALKIPAEVVVAEREPFSADPGYPARPSRFDHPLVVARLPEGDLWIDADLPGPPLPPGRVSPELRGRMALRVSGEQIAVQGANPEEARDEVEIALKVDSKGNAAGTFSVQLQGRTAQILVDALDRVAGMDRKELLRGVVQAWMPWATVNDVAMTPAAGSNILALRAEVVVPSLAQGEGQGWTLPGFEPLHSVFPRPTASTLGAAYASRLGRQSALAVDTAVQYRVHRRIELPLGWKLPTSLPSVAIQHELFEASRSGQITGSTLEETYVFSLTTGTVQADAYERFAAQAKRVDDGFLTSIRIAP
ncbi:MAG: hypothetical protein NZX77_01795 [Polyangiaceae bacterium]|nr:hypothetical protein [Polyangiaceae bacterium]